MIALGNLRRKPFRTATLVVSITMLTTLLIIAFTANRRMGLGIARTVQRMGGDIMVVPVGAVSDPEEFHFGSQRIRLRMKRSIAEKLAGMAGVEKVTAHTYLSTLPGLCCDIAEARIIAFDPATDFVIGPWLSKAINRDLQRDEIVLGAGVEGIELYEVDQEAWMLGRKFSVAGYLGKSGTALDNSIFVREDDVREVIEKGLTGMEVSTDEISVAFLSLLPGIDDDTVAKTIEREFLEVKAISRGTISGRLKNSFAAIRQVFTLTVGIGSVMALLVVGTVFSAVANERKREVGITRALGATRRDVLRLFLLEALFTGALGSLIGLAASSAIGGFVTRKIGAIAGFESVIPMSQLLAIDIAGVAAGTAVCIIGALFPVVRINRLDPLDAIKEVEATRRKVAAVPSNGAEADRGGEEAIVAARRAVKTYRDGDIIIKAVDSVDLDIRRGEFVAILGHSGSGKTTLLSMIGGLTLPDSGHIFVEGGDLQTLDDSGLATFRNRKIGFVFQFASLIPTLTAVENVLFPVSFSRNRHSGLGPEAERLM